MKIKLVILPTVLIMVMSAMVMTVSAADTGTTTITGNPSATIDIVVHGSINDWILNLGSNSDSSSVTLDVISNQPGWSVAVNDALDGAQKPAGSAGKMTNWTGSEWNQTIWLANELHVGAASVSGHATGTSVTLSGTGQPIETGNSDVSGAGTFLAIPITNSQQIIDTDARLKDPDKYRIIVTFTGISP